MSRTTAMIRPVPTRISRERCGLDIRRMSGKAPPGRRLPDRKG